MLLTFAMLFSMIGTVNVSAVDTGETSTKRGKVGIDYLGNGSTPATTAQAMPDPAQLISGKYLWVGLYLSDLKNMEDSNAEVIVSNNNVAGYFNITSSIEFASKYLNYVTTTTSKQMDYLNATNVWSEEYVTNQEDVDNYGDEPIMAKKGEAYTATVANRASVSSTGREPAVIAAEDTPNSVTVQLMANDDAPRTARIFADGSKNDKIYIAIVGFRVKNTATAENPIPGGTKLVTAGLNAADFTASTGTASETLFTAAWHTDRTNTSAGNLKNFLDYQGDPNFVPAGVVSVPVKVELDGGSQTTAASGTISSSDTAYKFSDIKSKLGSNPTKAGHTFAGWSLTSGGTVLTDDSNVTVSADMKDAGITFYAIFTKDKVNYTAADFDISDNTVTYNKAAQKPTVAFKSGVGGTITKVYVGAAANSAVEAGQTNKGTYKVYVDVTGDADHNNATKLEVGSFTINPLEVAIAITDKTTDYTGSAISVDNPTVTTTTGTTVSWADTGCTLKYNNAATAINAGTYNVVVSGLNANYSLKSGTGTGTLKINPKAITATLTTPTDKVYNGQSQKAVTANVTGATLTAGTDYDITYKQNNAAADPKNAGTYDVAFVLKNNNYSIASAPTGTYTIGQKALNPTLVVTVSQNNAQSGPYTLTDAAATITASDKVGNDAVNVTVSGTIAETDIKAGGNGKTVNNPTYKVDNKNYVIGTASVTANVTNLPVANDLDAATKAKLAAQTMKASDANNTEDYLITKLANLPTEGQSNIAGNDGKVNIEWTVDKTYDAKGTKYTYTGKVTAADPSKITASIGDITVEVTVIPVEVTAPAVNNLSAKLNETAPTLTTAGTTTGDVAVPFTIAWEDGDGNPVTTLTTDEVKTVTYTGKVTYDVTGKDWVTVPEAAKTVTITYTVTDQDKIKIDSVDAVAEVKTNAADEKNTAEDIASLLPTTVKAKDAAGNDVELAVTWATTDIFEIKGGEYTYTATFTDGAYDVSAITEPVTVKLTVAPVTVKFNKTFKDLSVKKSADNSTFEALGVAADALSGTIKADDNVTDVQYTIAWTPASTELDTSKSGAKQEFTGTVTFAETPEWMTVVTPEPVKMNIKVKSSGGGGSSVSTYIVKFSAGKYGKIENGENQNIELGKTVTKLPTVTPNDGYKFIGWSVDGGKTVIDPATEKITKATTFTAVYEEVEVTPTPTPTPLIKNNLKPYASGYDDGMFLPNDYITRAELASMIARLIEGDDISESYRASFPDVDNTWYNKYIGYLEDKDVLSGYEDGTFKPNQTVTRGEMCAIIVRAQRYGLIPMDGMFTDVTDADWAKDYITTLASMNVVSGYEDGTFGTYSPITRAETVAIINRVLKPSTPVITLTPLDIAGHWAEADILLAVNERELIGSESAVTPEPTPEVTPEPETTPDPEATPEATAEPTETPAA